MAANRNNPRFGALLMILAVLLLGFGMSFGLHYKHRVMKSGPEENSVPTNSVGHTSMKSTSGVVPIVEGSEEVGSCPLGTGECCSKRIPKASASSATTEEVKSSSVVVSGR